LVTGYSTVPSPLAGTLRLISVIGLGPHWLDAHAAGNRLLVDEIVWGAELEGAEEDEGVERECAEEDEGRELGEEDEPHAASRSAVRMARTNARRRRQTARGSALAGATAEILRLGSAVWRCVSDVASMFKICSPEQRPRAVESSIASPVDCAAAAIRSADQMSPSRARGRRAPGLRPRG